MELCDTYNLLAEQFTLTENGYKIEISSLETLRNAQIETAVSANQQAEGYLKQLVGHINDMDTYNVYSYRMADDMSDTDLMVRKVFSNILAQS